MPDVAEAASTRAEVDLQGIGVARRSAQQRRQGRMFLTGELADAKTFDRCVERRAFESAGAAGLRSEANCSPPSRRCRRVWAEELVPTQTGSQDRALKLSLAVQVQRDTKTASMPFSL